MGRAFEELGWEVISLDVDSKASPTICADICSWEPLPKFAPGYFDMIWASPVCTEYSRVLTRRPGVWKKATGLVLRTLQIIQELQPRFWALENPATGLLKLRPFMAALPWRDVSCCTCGYPYRKLTNIWGNLDWVPERPVCGLRGYLRAVQGTGSASRGGAEGHRPPQGKNRAELPNQGQPYSSAGRSPPSSTRGWSPGPRLSLPAFVFQRLRSTPHSTAVSLP